MGPDPLSLWGGVCLRRLGGRGADLAPLDIAPKMRQQEFFRRLHFRCIIAANSLLKERGKRSCEWRSNANTGDYDVR